MGKATSCMCAKEGIQQDGYETSRSSHTWYSMQEQLDKNDEERVEEERVASRLAERQRLKMMREREDQLMEERKKKS